ncbi:ADP-heptose--LPS heptosyltransferase 2 [Vibrio aestuarianus]|nr:lipopolysaccharide heptosyltransferase II [Vibrio aestuarianus]CAH8182204.1 ADP-heptose--LPS heptosyltransferase 2 [Vibrio aestuarianus subsp. francensis]CAH8182207.1 ADP-heptose--LPS heptosyltransferase 2 [Vibrio aestuarianus]CAH8182274.1 ADP-heptose--LPS heptosyltransferase 2 [Vibrio aestuarianus]CAH8182343.1 ADP-heptose--LPS heptosyltransferase 2 [Vibrio aestuarianus]
MPFNSQTDEQQNMKILIIGPSWVGDMVMSQSFYATLKQNYPTAMIDVLAPAWCKPILERMPEINSAIEMPIGHGAFNLAGRWALAKELKRNGYTHAYILPNSAKSALIPLFAGIPSRTGWKGEFRYGLLNDLRPNRKVFQFMVERYVALAYSKTSMLSEVQLETCPRPSLSIDSTAQQYAMSRLGLSTTKPIVGLCPGAEFGPAKRWPDKYYAEVAKALIEKGQQVWLFGSAKDKVVTHAIRNSLPKELQSSCFDLAGETSLIEAVDLLAACHTVICNDSGLMHVSAAVGCNIVAIYGSSSPKYTPPLADNVEIIHTDIECRPCFKRECPLKHLDCLNKLSPNLVMAAVNKFIG